MVITVDITLYPVEKICVIDPCADGDATSVETEAAITAWVAWKSVVTTVIAQRFRVEFIGIIVCIRFQDDELA
ncbi:MAG: hypothetical protein J0M04_07365 [Verrucomicrobia bacterium]|nr:hypothetical protein [Verrucomicrobiota bacterium]